MGPRKSKLSQRKPARSEEALWNILTKESPIVAAILKWLGLRLKPARLVAILILCAVGIVGVPIAFVAAKDAYMAYRLEEDIHAMQDLVKSIEDNAEVLIGPLEMPSTGHTTEIEYRDKITYQRVIVDLYVVDQREYREFFSDGDLIARDKFTYYDEMYVGKIREYLRGGRIVLVDEFTPLGLLKRKKYLIDGEVGRAVDYLRADFRSPLPPVFLFTYR
jgi:hypothetical protein